ncbi:hypothetical protein [Anaerovorax sp. IOR16]|uniref:hypothetical protein n=1 Tax=Anaerovorax sp. IOR16 TaxID=2773458 RepID=UPI0019D04B64|nr:hypothetical protein [Anaerovorax sp. IOR16]
MKKITKLQILTIIAIIVSVGWEIYVQLWAKGIEGPIIRVDLLFILPVLFVLVCISIFQLVKRKSETK